MTLKVLVTGSRDWTDARRVELEIFRALYETKTPHREAVLIHGACPTGADALAVEYARVTGMHIVRNAEMVDLAPDICLAFIRNGSRGASMTATLAETGGVETRRFLA
ncbi:SLOG family protein [Streptomyces decoyicus]|uniref:SLOG family protein n=1 Tax=Streptomyces decoyicus TaxID=249567 RepID=UPI0036307D3D